MNTKKHKLSANLRRQIHIAQGRASTLDQNGNKKTPGKWGHRKPSMPTFKALEKQGDER